jgi:hypothetical protein
MQQLDSVSKDIDLYGHPTEAASVKAWTLLLAEHFEIENEVPGARCCQTTKVRVDMLLHPKFEWGGGGRFPIAFEIKKPTGKNQKALAQAADYAQCRWISTRYRQPIQTYVAIHAPLFEEPQIGFSPPHFLGSFGIMLLRIERLRTGQNVLSLNLSSTPMWTSKSGARNMNWNAQRRFGSR